jgi:hypothetical protein
MPSGNGTIPLDASCNFSCLLCKWMRIGCCWHVISPQRFWCFCPADVYPRQKVSHGKKWAKQAEPHKITQKCTVSPFFDNGNWLNLQLHTTFITLWTIYLQIDNSRSYLWIPRALCVVQQNKSYSSAKCIRL